jgi:large subunit ribosomal protein L21
MTYAIIETGGKQLRVEPGRFYDVERLAVDEDGTVVIDQVLFVENEGSISVGQPLVEGATVEATVLRHLRGRKIIVYKMRPKKKTRKKQGHRQELTRLMINSISLGGKVIGGEASTSAPTPTPAEPEPASTTADDSDLVEAES